MKVTRAQLRRIIREEAEKLSRRRPSGVIDKLLSTLPGTVSETYEDDPDYRDILRVAKKAAASDLPLAAAVDAVKRGYEGL